MNSLYEFARTYVSESISRNQTQRCPFRIFWQWRSSPWGGSQSVGTALELGCLRIRQRANEWIHRAYQATPQSCTAPRQRASWCLLSSKVEENAVSDHDESVIRVQYRMHWLSSIIDKLQCVHTLGVFMLALFGILPALAKVATMPSNVLNLATTASISLRSAEAAWGRQLYVSEHASII